MSQSKFAPGDIIEHKDGSLYILEEITETEYIVATILETNSIVKHGEYRPERRFVDELNRWKVIGHIDDAV